VTSLILPDPHEEIDLLERILYNNKADHYVILGDFFDSWTIEPERWQRMARFVEQNSRDPQFSFLWGNHDAHYRWSEVPGIHSSGFMERRLHEIREIVTPAAWDAFRFFKFIDGWLISHAGFHRGLLHPTLGAYPEFLAQQEQQCLEHLNNKILHPWVIPGYVVGGRHGDVGGVIWNRWEKEFEPIAGVNQIVGHTRGPVYREKNIEGSRNYCIDTDLKYGIYITDGDAIVKRL
jgi:hypothetical protein